MPRPEPAKTDTTPDLSTALSAPRIVIDRVRPSVDDNRFPAKGIVGQGLVVSADIFSDGHDQLAADLLWTDPVAGTRRLPLRELDNDRWQAIVTPVNCGRHSFTLEAWLDRWATYQNELRKKHNAGIPVGLEIEEGRRLIAAAAKADSRGKIPALHALAKDLKLADEARACALLLSADATAAMLETGDKPFLTRYDAPIQVEVERVAAGFASWYELFPRSQTESAARHGTFDDVIARLPALRAMGFDVLYLPPIHPIGTTHRKGRNNSVTATADEPGSPYAIGSADGGHDAVHPELGGIDAFRRLRTAAADQGLELALDFAVQCSPDHPWLREHPGWFSWRPDGTVRHAENPPKKYQDIVNVDFYAADATPALWLALRDIVQFWVDEGVRIFRVDNPHTKPLPFWQWLIADIRARTPEVIFLAEAFTRPAMMYRLGKIGFAQSYTYFTWRHSKAEFTQYLQELSEGPARDYFRPHFFVNTPDINPYFLQTSGRPGFLIRAALAATLSGLWGVYSGFELCDGAALPGKEEYLDSEKYQIRPRPLASFTPAPTNIIGEISRLNRIRRDNPALHTHLGIRFYHADNDQVLYFSKATPDRTNVVLVAISLDPFQPQSTHLEVPLADLDLSAGAVVEVIELMSNTRLTWQGNTQHWYFTPAQPFAIWRLDPAAG